MFERLNVRGIEERNVRVRKVERAWNRGAERTCRKLNVRGIEVRNVCVES